MKLLLSILLNLVAGLTGAAIIAGLSLLIRTLLSRMGNSQHVIDI